MIDAPIETVETEGVISIRGIVQKIRRRTFVVVEPAVVVATQSRGEQ